MKDKSKNTKGTQENIKTKLDSLLELNKKRKSALEKMSKSLDTDKKRLTKKS